MNLLANGEWQHDVNVTDPVTSKVPPGRGYRRMSNGAMKVPMRVAAGRRSTITGASPGPHQARRG